MPHVVYYDENILCPWPGCGLRLEMIDFRLEAAGNPALYARVMRDWHLPAYGLVGRCPGCRGYVLFRVLDKLPVTDPGAPGLPVLPDDWHTVALIV